MNENKTKSLFVVVLYIVFPQYSTSIAIFYVLYNTSVVIYNKIQPKLEQISV